MALAKEIMGSSLMERSSFIASNRIAVLNHKQDQLCVKRRNLQLRKGVRTVVNMAAVSENLVKAVPEKAVSFKVRAVVTVKNKHKQDLKDTIVKQLDAFTDKIGRNVLLELFSTDIDPSNPHPHPLVDFAIFYFIINLLLFWVSSGSLPKLVGVNFFMLNLPN